MKYTTRRDLCFVIGRRASRLTPPAAAKAWESLARQLEAMGSRDVPKFADVASAIRTATIAARRAQ